MTDKRLIIPIKKAPILLLLLLCAVAAVFLHIECVYAGAKTDVAVSIPIRQEVSISGQYSGEERFVYRLIPDNASAPMPQGSEQTGVYDISLTGNTATSITIPYNTVGVYSYTLQPYIAERRNNIVYDTNAYGIDVYVRHNAAGDGINAQLVITNRDGNKPAEALFTNSIKGEQVQKESVLKKVSTGDVDYRYIYLSAAGFALLVLILILLKRKKNKWD